MNGPHTPASADSTETTALPAAGIRGSWVIASIVAVAAVSAVAAVVYHYQNGRRVLDYLGRDNAICIRDADRVTLVPLTIAAADADSNRSLRVGEQTWLRGEPIDLTRVRGLSHISKSLLVDSTYAWETAGDHVPNWQWLLEYQDGDRRVALLLDLDGARLLLVGRDDPLDLTPATPFLSRFIALQTGAETTTRTEATTGT